MGDLAKKKEFIINVLYLACIGAIIYFVLKYALSLFMPFIIAYLLVSTFRPFVLKTTKNMRINSDITMAVIMGVFFLLLGGGISWLVLQLVLVIKDFFVALPGFYNDSILPAIMVIANWFEGIAAYLPQFLKDGMVMDSLTNGVIGGIQSFTLNLSQGGISFIGGLIGSTPDFTVRLVFIILMSIFLSVHYETVMTNLAKFIPRKAYGFIGALKKEAKHSVAQYIKAYIKIMCITFGELSLGLLLLRVHNAIGIAALIAIFDALPVVGTGAIMIPWIFIEIIKGELSFGIGLAIVYGVITVARNVIEPKIVGDQLGLNPVLSLVAIYAGYRVFGVLGMILCPIAVQIALVLLQDYDYKGFKAE